MIERPTTDLRGYTRITLYSVFILLIAMVPMKASAKKNPPPDAIFINGKVYPGSTIDGKNDRVLPRAEAIAVRGDRIVAVGSDADINRLKGKHTQVIDLGGHFVMPGFNDAHAHLAAGGLSELQVDLIGVKSLREMQERIAAAAKSMPAGEWVIGRGWDQTLWPGTKLPARQDLDVVTAGHPAIFQRVDGHIAVMNSAGLSAMGITRATPDPTGGRIDHDASGEPNGIVRDVAKDDVLARLPEPSPAMRRRGIELAMRQAVSWGLTSVQDSISVENDPKEWDEFLVYEDLEREGKLLLRVTKWLPFSAPLDVLEAHRAHHPASDLMLHTGMLKGFLDGSLGSRTAALIQPYSDDPNNRGVLYHPDQAKLDQMMIERVRAGFQVGLHAIGDRSAQQALDAYGAAEHDAKQRGDNRPPSAFRFRVEHAQVATAAQFQQYKDEGVIASMQPCHLLDDMRWAEARLGPERVKYSYDWKQFLDDGVPLAFGTDFAVEPLNPFRNLYAAITRMNEAGTQTYPGQKLNIDEAISAYTTGSAYAEFAEKDKGLLWPGYLADFVVLDRDITKTPPEEILKTRVLRTVVGGKTVNEAK